MFLDSKLINLRNYSNLISVLMPAQHFRPHPQGRIHFITLQRAFGAPAFFSLWPRSFFGWTQGLAFRTFKGSPLG